MQTVLVKCGWCERDAYPNELRYSKKLEVEVCHTCDPDNDQNDKEETEADER